MAITERQASRIVLGAGALLAVYGAAQWWYGERVFARMRAATCTVLSKKIESELVFSGKRNKRARYRDEAHVVFAHTLDGRRYTFTEDFTEDWVPHVRAGYEEGKAYPCRYDPQDPRHGTVMAAFDSHNDRTTIVLGGLVILLGFFTPRAWRDTAARIAEMRRR